MSRTFPWAMSAAASLTLARLSAGDVDARRRIPQRAGYGHAHTGPLGGHDARHDRQGGHQRARTDVLAEQRRRPPERQERLDQLDLTDLRDAAARQRRVPGEE